ncbi:hypothetical protein [Streptomyces sp. NPDC058335]|uniref:hypothetical protein n=1 Tax=Streptomyces sp. NPDC058335 TaxID=3346451 RepID=UPI00365BF924
MARRDELATSVTTVAPAEPGRLSRVLAATAVVTAVLLAVAGTVLWQQRRAAAVPEPVATAELGGLRAVPRQASWATMEQHHADNGYQMPSQMMPGAPEGDDQRLGVPITLTNTGDRVREFTLPEEFFLDGGTGKPHPLHSDTLGTLPRLSPGSAVRGVLYFDVEAPEKGDPPLYLVWRRDGEQARMTVRVTGASAPHAHGS